MGRRTAFAIALVGVPVLVLLAKARHDVAVHVRPIAGASPDLLPSAASWRGSDGLVLAYRVSLNGSAFRVDWTWSRVDLEYQ